MEYIVGLAIILFVAFLLKTSNKAYRQIRTPHDYLSFGASADENTLQKALEGANASFATVTVALFAYAFVLGTYALAIPAGFCIGIVFYAYVILPKKMHLLAEGVRYPELLERSTNSRAIRYVIAMIIVISIWLFTLVEVQALNLFLAELFKPLELSYYVISLAVVLVITFYATRGGYRAVILTDKIQVRIIYLGSASLLIGNLLLINEMGFDRFWHATLMFESPFETSTNSFMFIVETIVGLLFSQLLYYDNWQRLSFFVREHVAERRPNSVVSLDEQLKRLQVRIAKRYLYGSIAIFLIYIIPIWTGYIYAAQGVTDGNLTLLVDNVRSIWAIVPILGPVLVILIVLQFVSSLMSTADTYVIGATNTIYEDLLRKPILSVNEVSDRKSLKQLRTIAMLFSTSILLVVLINPDVKTLFLILFYSVNGLAGPVYIAILRGNVNRWAVFISLLFGGVYTVIPAVYPESTILGAYPGIVPVIFSLLVASLWQVPQANLVAAQVSIQTKIKSA